MLPDALAIPVSDDRVQIRTPRSKGSPLWVILGEGADADSAWLAAHVTLTDREQLSKTFAAATTTPSNTASQCNPSPSRRTDARRYLREAAEHRYRRRQAVSVNNTLRRRYKRNWVYYHGQPLHRPEVEDVIPVADWAESAAAVETEQSVKLVILAGVAGGESQIPSQRTPASP